MTLRRSFMFAVQALTFGLATLVTISTSEAGLRLRIEEFTNDSYSVSKGGYTVASTATAADFNLTNLDEIIFTFTTTQLPAPIGTVGTPGATNTYAVLNGVLGTNFGVTGPTAFNGANGGPDFRGLSISTRANSKESAKNSQLVDAEIQSSNSGLIDRYLAVTVEMDFFDRPDTDPLAFDIEQSVNENVTSSNSMSYFQGSLDTGYATQTLGFIGTGDASSGPVAVANPNQNLFILSTVTRLVIGGNGGSITTTGTANVAATPEPGMLATAVVGIGLLGGAGWLRRRRKAD